MKLKVYYLNDEQKDTLIKIIHNFTFDPNQPHLEPKIEFFPLKSCQDGIFEIDAPEGSIPFVKKWPAMVLLTFLPLEAQRQIASGK